MTTPNQEDERAANAFLLGMTETVHGTASGLLKRGFKYGHATAREKCQEEIEALSRTLNDMNEGGLETEAKLDKAEALLQEVAHHGACECFDDDVCLTCRARTVLEEHNGHS